MNSSGSQSQAKGSLSNNLTYRGNSSSTKVIVPNQPSATPQNTGSIRFHGGSISLCKCFKCYRFGHIASDCPNQKVVNLIEEAGNEEGDADQPMEEEVTYAD